MAYKSLSLTGAAGDGATDDTAALAAWIGQINAAQPPIALLPPGQFLVSYPLPPITASAVIIAGVGWAQQASTRGSSIFAGSSFAGDLLTIEGEGVELRGLTVDGRNHVPTLIAVTGGHFRFIDSQARAVASGGVCIDIRSGGSAARFGPNISRRGGASGTDRPSSRARMSRGCANAGLTLKFLICRQNLAVGVGDLRRSPASP